MENVGNSTLSEDPELRQINYSSVEEEECDSEEEEQLLPPPKSWFEPVDQLDNHFVEDKRDEQEKAQERDSTTSEASGNYECSGLPENEEKSIPGDIIESSSDDNIMSPMKTHDNNQKQKYNKLSSSSTVVVVGPAPSKTELATEFLPAAARELLSTSMQRLYYYSRVSYSRGRWRRQYSDLGNNTGGYFRASEATISNKELQRHAISTKIDNSPFSSLAWVERQLVREWRTCDLATTCNSNNNNEKDMLADDDMDVDFDRARTLVPKIKQRPKWLKAEACVICHKPFGPTLLRHHCRLCGNSYCSTHSAWTHRLPHLGYPSEVPERVCDPCKRLLGEWDLAERVAWRAARCRDYMADDLTPYFETGVDTVEDAALRITQAAISMARSIPLGAQAHVAVETVDVLRKHGIKGIYGLILRKEFMAAADLLCRALGINSTVWPLSVHELSAAIFYALAQHRAMRGMSPEREHLIHSFRCYPDRENIDVNGNGDHQILPGNTSTAAGEEEEEDDEISSSSSKSNTADDNETQWTSFVSSTGNQLVYPEKVNKNNLPTVVEGKEGGETIPDVTTSLVDDTDTYNPMAESVADLIAMADNAIQNHHKNSEIEGKTRQSAVLDNGPNDIGIDISAAHNETVDSVEKDRKIDDRSEMYTELPFTPVCEPVSDAVISSLLFYAPIAMNFVYATREVDMQLLAAQQGWRLLYANLAQDTLDLPASALFVHRKQKIACFAVRGTATINDVVTDIRQMPVPFPETAERDCSSQVEDDSDWTPVFRGQGLAVCGMASAAVNLYREHIDAIFPLAEQGYRIRITGHSLGGGVATLLGALVLRHIENVANLEPSMAHAMRFAQEYDGSATKNTLFHRCDLLRVYGYGTPSCVDAKLSDYVKSFVTTVVLHDDVVPRLTPTSIRGLMKHLLHIRETWVKAHLETDLIAITERARTVWAPRWRGGFTLAKPSPKSVRSYFRKHIHIGKKTLLIVKQAYSNNSIEESPSSEKDSKKGDSKSDEISNAVICNGEEEDSSSAVGQHIIRNDSDKINSIRQEDSGVPQYHLLVDYMGGIDYRTQGLVIDGDEFFDAEESLLEGDSEGEEGALFGNEGLTKTREFVPEQGSDDGHQTMTSEPSNRESDAEDESWANFDSSMVDTSIESLTEEQLPDNKAKSKSDAPLGSESQCLEESDDTCAVMLEETPLPRMFLPGKIVHIYTHRGGFKAAYVPRAFRELRRVSLAGNMLSDHTAKSYYEALLEVHSVRNAEEGLPRWTAFDEDDTCSCCASRFTWASTSDSEAQQARDKHNCRSCGTLVCDPCAKNKIPMPSVGITVPVRICDRCYNDIGGVLTGHAGHALTSSFIAEDDNKKESTHEMEAVPCGALQSATEGSPSPQAVNSEEKRETVLDQPERQRERRSIVVDELASRIHSSVITSA